MSRNQSKMNKEKQIFENQISLILREDKTLEIYVGDSLAAEISDGRLDIVVVKKSRHEKYLFLICFFKSRHEEYFCRSCFFKSGHGQ